MKNFRKVLLPLFAALIANCTAVPFAANAETSGEKQFSLGVRGDYNGDGELSVFDLMKLSRYLLGISEGPEISYESDINGDGKISIADYSVLKRALVKDTILWNMNSMPVMDGSTSEIPLETGFKAKMLGINYSDAGKLVKHHKTHESFKMLLSGENDLIFTVPISEDQKKQADEAGVHLNFAPVAKEGFVFVVNKKNPVDSLTQEQIKDIYSGKITNWKELGGNDEEIIPYQRNNDSGSQNYMTEFMKDSELMAPVKEMTPGSMGDLMDAVAVYDNASGAIGYSVYSYAAQMYENSDEVKLIAVDGIKPSRETMADGSYPLLSDSYIIYTDSASDETLDFVDWALSEEGQMIALENGYVPVMDIEYPERLKAYLQKGTGEKRPDNYKPEEYYSDFWYSIYPVNKTSAVDFLKDKDFQKKVNEDIQNVLNSFDSLNDFDISANIKNGYMSVVFQEGETFSATSTSSVCHKIKTLNYDLKHNKKIENYSDLFYKDENFVSILNNYISKEISAIESEAYYDYIKTDFIGLTGSADKFTLDYFFLSEDNPYLAVENMRFYIDSAQFKDCMVWNQYFDNKQVVDERYYDHINDFSQKVWDVDYEAADENKGRYILKWSAFYSEEEKAEVQKVLDKVYEQGEAKNVYKEDEYPLRTTIYFPEKDKDKSTLNVYTVRYTRAGGETDFLMFDTQTGEQVFLSDIFGKEFEKYNDTVSNVADIDMWSNKVSLEYIDKENDTRVYETFDIDPEQIEKKYINVADSKHNTIELLTPRSGVLRYFSDIQAYASSYIIDYQTEGTGRIVEKGMKVTVKREVRSHDRFWCECWNADTNEYLGWINNECIYFSDINIV